MGDPQYNYSIMGPNTLDELALDCFGELQLILLELSSNPDESLFVRKISIFLGGTKLATGWAHFTFYVVTIFYYVTNSETLY